LFFRGARRLLQLHAPVYRLIDHSARYYIPGMTLTRDIIAAIVTLARLIRTEADKRARAHGMTRAQWTILVNLEKQPGLLQKELAEILEVEPITVARLVDRLEARGMVERRGDPTDRRCWRLHLTDASRPLMSEIGAQLTDLADIVTAGLPEETRHLVAASLASMRDAITAEARRTPAPAAEPLEPVAEPLENFA
jgi:DNA-binding MarR family transcriptional regulator